MIQDFEKIEGLTNDLVALMLKKDLKAHYTVTINLWDDNTFRIQCRSGINIDEKSTLLRDYIWYKGKISYEEKTIERKYGTCG